jgi:hypothetical protein
MTDNNRSTWDRFKAFLRCVCRHDRELTKRLLELGIS